MLPVFRAERASAPKTLVAAASKCRSELVITTLMRSAASNRRTKSRCRLVGALPGGKARPAHVRAPSPPDDARRPESDPTDLSASGLCHQPLSGPKSRNSPGWKADHRHASAGEHDKAAVLDGLEDLAVEIKVAQSRHASLHCLAVGCTKHGYTREKPTRVKKPPSTIALMIASAREEVRLSTQSGFRTARLSRSLCVSCRQKSAHLILTPARIPHRLPPLGVTRVAQLATPVRQARP